MIFYNFILYLPKYTFHRYTLKNTKSFTLKYKIVLSKVFFVSIKILGVLQFHFNSDNLYISKICLRKIKFITLIFFYNIIFLSSFFIFSVPLLWNIRPYFILCYFPYWPNWHFCLLYKLNQCQGRRTISDLSRKQGCWYYIIHLIWTKPWVTFWGCFSNLSRTKYKENQPDFPSKSYSNHFKPCTGVHTIFF